ncbi:MAG TPA: hypothetical protein VH062_25690 [Polyangiaceae bacterium]|nr:hypothetical protein [Polyangiaceae bacterium]
MSWKLSGGPSLLPVQLMSAADTSPGSVVTKRRGSAVRIIDAATPASGCNGCQM